MEHYNSHSGSHPTKCRLRPTSHPLDTYRNANPEHIPRLHNRTHYLSSRHTIHRSKKRTKSSQLPVHRHHITRTLPHLPGPDSSTRRLIRSDGLCFHHRLPSTTTKSCRSDLPHSRRDISQRRPHPHRRIQRRCHRPITDVNTTT